MSDDKSVPKPGHFLPGGDGDGTTVPEPSSGSSESSQSQPGLGKPEPLSLSSGTGHPQQHAYSWSAARDRGAESPPPPPFEAARQFSRPVIAGFAALALLVVSGGVALAAQLIRSYDDLVENPLSNPSVRTPSASPSGSEPSPTPSPSATPTPDALVVKQNKLYATGKLTPSKCKEPAVRPTSKVNVQKYSVEMVQCLDRSWSPSVRKAGFEFRSPTLVFDVDAQDCGSIPPKNSAYCGDGETIYLPWKDFVDNYPKQTLGTRLSLTDTVGRMYGYHVQKMTGILEAWHNRFDVAPNKSAELEEKRRVSLQTTCLAGMYLGANRNWHPLRGRALTQWKYLKSHNGDEDNADKIPDEGSRKNMVYWSQRGFLTMDPKYCNTFAAPSAKVS